jgi:HD-GYP domain-containing protein (c-di-GMP phosphodiesterase class II)/uncharacterized protein YigA (DUF484 family)
MTRFPFSGLRVRLILLVLLAVLPALGLTFHTATEQRRVAAAETQANARRLVRLVSIDQELWVEGAHQLLVALAQLPQVRSGDPAACSAFFADLLKQYRGYTNFVATEPDGAVFCSGQPLAGPVNFADRAWFRRTLETSDFVVGEYVIGRITGKAILTFAYPILDQAGQVQAVVSAGLDLAWLNQLAAEVELPPGSALTVIDRNGTILARHPDPEQWVGQSMPEAPLLKAILAQGDGTAETVGVDGVPRLYAFTPLGGVPPDGNVTLSIGIPKEVAFAEIDRTMARNLAGLGLVTVLALAAAWVGGDVFLLRRVNVLVGATQRLAAGDLGARTGEPYGQGELSQLARAFDQMAATLEQNEAERKRAEEQVRQNAARAEALVRTAARLNAQLDLQAVLNTICEETARALNVPAASVTLYDEQRQVFFHAADFGLPPEYRQHARPVPCAIYEEYTRQMGQVKVVPDLQILPNLADADLYVALNIRTGVSVSMLRENQLVGGLNVFTFGEVRHFSEDELALLKGLADQAAQAIVNARLFAAAGRRLEYVQALHDIDKVITASLDLRFTLNALLDQVITQLGIHAADILLFNPPTQTLEYAAGRGFRSRALQHTRLRLGEGHAGRAALKRHIVHIPDLATAENGLSRAPLLAIEEFITYYGVPLIVKGQVKGVLEIFHRAPLDPDPEWVDFLEALAAQAAIAIDNASLFNDLQRSNVELILAYDSTLEGWARALDLRDRETEGHTRRVAELTLRLARALGMSQAEPVHVYRGALLHDIGKMGIPDSILHKPGPLSQVEWEIMRRHPVYAYDMLAPIAYLRPALDIPYCHHEKWDGTGYPQGLKGEQIPPAARIFAVVDVWDALRSERPYRPAWPEEKVREYIREQAGVHFDPQVVEAFWRVLETGYDELREHG